MVVKFFCQRVKKIFSQASDWQREKPLELRFLQVKTFCDSSGALEENIEICIIVYIQLSIIQFNNSVMYLVYMYISCSYSAITKLWVIPLK